MRTTYKQTTIFRNSAISYLRQNEAETKLKLALEKQLKATTPAANEYVDKVQDMSFQYAAVDQDGCVLYTTRPNGHREYKHTKEGLKAFDAAVEELYNKADTVEFEPMVIEFPEDIHESWVEIFKPFVEKKD